MQKYLSDNSTVGKQNKSYGIIFSTRQFSFSPCFVCRGQIDFLIIEVNKNIEHCDEINVIDYNTYGIFIVMSENKKRI